MQHIYRRLSGIRSYLGAQTKNLASRRADEERRIVLYPRDEIRPYLAQSSIYWDLTWGRGQYIQVYLSHSQHGAEEPLLYSVKAGPALVHCATTRAA